MKSNKLFRVAAGLLIAANILAFTACSQQNASAATNTANAPNAANAQNGQNTIYGKVTAVDGTKITLALGTLNQRGGGQQGNSSENNPGSRPNGAGGGQQTSGAGRPQQGTGSRQGGAANGWQGSDLLTMTGETKTITITDPSIITRFGMRGANGDTPRNGQGRPLMRADGSSSAAQSTSVQNSAPAVVNTAANTVSSAQGGASGTGGQNSASLSDITVGTILRVTFNTGSDTPVSVQIMGASGGGQSSSSSQSN